MDLKVIILTMLAANALPKPFEIPQHQENHGGGVQHEYAIAFIISVLASVFVFVVIEGWKKRSALKKIFRRIRRRFSKVKEIDDQLVDLDVNQHEYKDEPLAKVYARN